MNTGHILIGDAVNRMRSMGDGSVDMVLTSPPYFRLRDYEQDAQIGLETHVDAWVDRLLPITREVRRLVGPTGTFWLNLGDSYSTHLREGAPRKSLLLAPERLVLAMAGDGWILRNKIVWAKTNPRPTSVTDRLACAWEPVYLFAAGPRAYFDLDAIRLPHRTQPRRPNARREAGSGAARGQYRGPNSEPVSGLSRLHAEGRAGHILGKNPGDVWQLPSGGLRGVPHPAVFPPALAERIIRAGCPERRCSTCCQPYTRLIRSVGSTAVRGVLRPRCSCKPVSHEPGVVLDPFMGAGTTAVAAERLGRQWVGIELNPAYAATAKERIERYRQNRPP